MEPSTSNSSDLAEVLFQNANRRRLEMEKIFEKYDSSDDEGVTFDINDIPVDWRNFTRKHFRHRLNLKNPTPYQKDLAYLIESKLGSKLHKYVLKREKSKLLLDDEDYEKTNEKLKKEMKRLRRHFYSDEHIMNYIWLICSEKNEKITHIIDHEMKSKMRQLLSEREESMKDEGKLKQWKENILGEYHVLIMVLPAEDVIKYMVCTSNEFERKDD